MSRKSAVMFAAGVSLGILLSYFAIQSVDRVSAQDRTRADGGVRENTNSIPKPVRNDTAIASTPIVTKRYFKIQKGKFPEVLKVSQEGIWPFFEKIGSRVIGMWLVAHPDGVDSETSPDYDEVYLMTQYASVDHWRATREMAAIGGNGPDFDKCMEAIRYRRSLTIETSLQFLQGSTWTNPPYYMPGLEEEYTKK
jgi:hypothetical protein